MQNNNAMKLSLIYIDFNHIYNSKRFAKSCSKTYEAVEQKINKNLHVKH